MKRVFNKFLIQPKIVLSIFLLTSLIVLISALLEYNQSKKEINKLMENQSHTLLDAILISSNDAIKSYNLIKSEINQRLLNNAIFIKYLYENNLLTNGKLTQIAKENELFRINVFSKNGSRLFSSHPLSKFEQTFQNKSKEILKEIFNGEVDTLQIGIKESQLSNSYRYVVAVAAKDRSAIVINIDANKLVELRKESGFGPLLKKFTQNKNIIYLIFQNENGIIAASGNFKDLDDLNSSSFLQKSFNEEKFYSRIFETDSISVFESVNALIINNSKLGIIRLGLSTEPLDQIAQKIINRTIIQSIFLLVFGVITFSFLFIRQNYDSLSKKFRSIETYFKNIFDNVSDSIILFSNKLNIEAVNNSALELFNSKDKYELELNFNSFFVDLIKIDFTILEKEISINDQTKFLLISKTIFNDEAISNKFIFVIKDITNQKIIEKQNIRNQQLSALSDLSSSVAHEIRNPLNAIATITQQIGKDFTVNENENEFKQLTKIVYKEVKRINSIIESFLKFARPLPINTESFSLKEFFMQLKLQYQNIFNEKNILFNIQLNKDTQVKWDKFQIKQVFINLIENSIDAVNNNGTISVFAHEIDNKIEIKFSDTGKGIQEDILDKIFNIYFTTKNNGNGLGLSIVQKIINEHNGLINVTSKINNGTTFTLILPKVVEVKNVWANNFDYRWWRITSTIT